MVVSGRGPGTGREASGLAPPTADAYAHARYQCEVCKVRFAKQSKRDTHLLEKHGAYYGLSARALTPSAEASVAAAVTAAVIRANRAFPAQGETRRSAVVCTQCPRDNAAKFRNPRDLAHHILSKHSDDVLIGEQSAVSYKMKKRKVEPHVASPRKVVKTEPRAASGAASSPTSSTTQLEVEAKPSAAKPPLSPNSGSSRSSRESTPKLGTTSGKRRTAQDGIRKPEKTCMAMDFTSLDSYTLNSRKSYYKIRSVVDR